LIRSPVAQFLTAGLLALVVIVVGTGRLSRQAAAEEAIDGARATTQVLARSVAEPAVPRGLVK
jgi:flavin-binding protein dodecin